MKNTFFLVVGLVFIVGSVFLFWNQPKTSPSTVRIGDTRIQVDIADSPTERAQGLSGRSVLDKGHGMLFVFEEEGDYGFWMREMNFGIDIVWIGSDWQVVGVTKGVMPESYPQSFRPPVPVLYVLEIPVGYADEVGIDTGDRVYLTP